MRLVAYTKDETGWLNTKDEAGCLSNQLLLTHSDIRGFLLFVQLKALFFDFFNLIRLKKYVFACFVCRKKLN